MTILTCAAARELFDAYLALATSVADTQEVADHLEGCVECSFLIAVRLRERGRG